MQLNLLEVPPRPEPWEQLGEEDRQAVVAQLAGMILAAALGQAGDKESNDA